jgi:hypothetical protein
MFTMQSLEKTIKNALEKIEVSSIEAREAVIKDFLSLVVDLYKSDTIPNDQFGYYVTSLVQYEDSFAKPSLFNEITKTEGLLELPANQLEEKGFDRQVLLGELLANIASFVK